MSRTPYTPPKISVDYEIEMDRYRIMATSYTKTELAGPRLFRAAPHPDIKFTHNSQADALKDAEKLRSYLDQCASGKIKDSKETSVRGWWED